MSNNQIREPSPGLFSLLRLVSPALPVGAYAYSQGLEYAIDTGWIDSPASLESWLLDVLNHNLVKLDLPVLMRAYDASNRGDIADLEYWNNFVLAHRETRELLFEDRQLGRALARLISDLDNDRGLTLDDPSWVSQFAVAGVCWSIQLSELMYGFAWSWLENQVAAATKLIPLGQTQAQSILIRLTPALSDACRRAVELSDDELGASLPGFILSSSLHEHQYSRLFRS